MITIICWMFIGGHYTYHELVFGPRDVRGLEQHWGIRYADPRFKRKACRELAPRN